MTKDTAESSKIAEGGSKFLKQLFKFWTVTHFLGHDNQFFHLMAKNTPSLQESRKFQNDICSY